MINENDDYEKILDMPEDISLDLTVYKDRKCTIILLDTILK